MADCVQYIRWLADLGSADVSLVGGKNASLGEMVHVLKREGISVPDGFAITAEAYREYVAANTIEEALKENINALKSSRASLHETGRAIRQLFIDGEFPRPIAEAIAASYRVAGLPGFEAGMAGWFAGTNLFSGLFGRTIGGLLRGFVGHYRTPPPASVPSRSDAI